jgi:hypothetical protein
MHLKRYRGWVISPFEKKNTGATYGATLLVFVRWHFADNIDTCYLSTCCLYSILLILDLDVSRHILNADISESMTTMEWRLVFVKFYVIKKDLLHKWIPTFPSTFDLRCSNSV